MLLFLLLGPLETSFIAIRLFAASIYDACTFATIISSKRMVHEPCVCSSIGDCKRSKYYTCISACMDVLQQSCILVSKGDRCCIHKSVGPALSFERRSIRNKCCVQWGSCLALLLFFSLSILSFPLLLYHVHRQEHLLYWCRLCRYVFILNDWKVVQEHGCPDMS